MAVKKAFALIYDVYHHDFPENDRKDGRRVIQQTVTSTTDNDTTATRLQAFKQACGYLYYRGVRNISADDPDFDPETDATLIRTESRIDGQRPSTIARARRRKQGLEKPAPTAIQPPPTPPKPAVKPAQAVMPF